MPSGHHDFDMLTCMHHTYEESLASLVFSRLTYVYIAVRTLAQTSDFTGARCVMPGRWIYVAASDAVVSDIF